MTVLKIGQSLKCNSIAQDELCHNKSFYLYIKQKQNQKPTKFIQLLLNIFLPSF